MAWCRQAASHFMNQCWLSSVMPYMALLDYDELIHFIIKHHLFSEFHCYFERYCWQKDDFENFLQFTFKSCTDFVSQDLLFFVSSHCFIMLYSHCLHVWCFRYINQAHGSEVQSICFIWLFIFSYYYIRFNHCLHVLCFRCSDQTYGGRVGTTGCPCGGRGTWAYW